MNKWLAAGIAVSAGLVLAGIARSVVHRALASDARPAALRSSASALSSLAFSAVLVVGLIVALGFVDPDSLDELPADLVAFVPKALSAAVLLIGANVAASFAGVALERGLAGSPPATRARVASAVRITLLAAAGLLAAAQLGINTTVLNLAAAALLFSIGAAFALLTGLGGRAVSAELAAGRSVRKMLASGDRVEIGAERGLIVEIHPAAIELQGEDGTSTLVPHSHFLERPTKVTRRPPAP